MFIFTGTVGELRATTSSTNTIASISNLVRIFGSVEWRSVGGRNYRHYIEKPYISPECFCLEPHVPSRGVEFMSVWQSVGVHL